MIKRPFSVRRLPTAPPETLEVSVLLASGPSEAGLLRIQKLMADLVTVAANGGLSGSRIPPVESTLTLTREEVAPNACSWTFGEVRIDPGATLVLENIIHYIHLHVCAVSQMSFTVPGGSLMAEPQDTPPRLYSRMPFECSVEMDSAEVTIDIEPANALDDEALRAPFAQLWQSWLYVAAAGGFETEDFSVRNLTIFPADEVESYPNEITLRMDDVSVSEQAYDALINGFQRLHQTVAPLSLVHIY